MGSSARSQGAGFILMVYGPGDHHDNRLIPYVVDSLLSGVEPALGSGRRRVDWVYIDEVVEALLAAAIEPAATGRVVDIGSGCPVSIRDTVTLIIDDRVERAAGVRRLPDRSGDRDRVADPGPAPGTWSGPRRCVSAREPNAPWRGTPSAERAETDSPRGCRRQREIPDAVARAHFYRGRSALLFLKARPAARGTRLRTDGTRRHRPGSAACPSRRGARRCPRRTCTSARMPRERCG
jgi:hypothetical protein